MRPAFLDNLSWEMAEVYGAVTDKLLINLAHYFPYIQNTGQMSGAFEYQARMLAKMGQINQRSIKIIMDNLGGADRVLRNSLMQSIEDALKNEEPKLRKAAKEGLLYNTPMKVSPNMMQAFQSYYKQSADRLNLVNTVMLESTQAAYAATVADVTQRIQRTQRILNVAAGETVTGVSSWNQAMHDAVRKMLSNGLTGFIDHGGHRWSPEAYVAMDVRTTMFNTSRAAIWERAESYGADMYQVSSHNGARPLCYPWQGKVISRSGFTGTVEDLDGNKIRVYSEAETTKGQAAGLFGINCKHYPMVFVPGFSTLKGEPQDPEENEKAYEESQEQRALERKLREEKRDLEVMKAQGAPEDQIKAQRAKVHKASADIDEFCDRTGRERRRSREYTPINATFPDTAGKPPVIPTPVTTTTVPTPTPTPTAPQNVASQATSTPQIQHTIVGKTDKLKQTMSQSDYDEVTKLIDKSEAVKLYETYGDSCQAIRYVRGGGVYKGSSDVVEYGFSTYAGQSKYSVMAHEMGHMFDRHIGAHASLSFKEVDTINTKCVIGSGMTKLLKTSPSTSDQFLSAMRKDKVGLEKILKDTAERAKMRTGSWENATAGVQDAMDGFFGTLDKHIFSWGHGNKYYNRLYNKRVKLFGLEKELKDAYQSLGMTVKNQTAVKELSRDYETASELWANIVSAITCGGDELDAFKQYMPETVEAAKKIIGGL